MRIHELSRRAVGEINCGHDPIKAIMAAIIDYSRDEDRPEWGTCSSRKIEFLRLISQSKRTTTRKLAKALGITPQSCWETLDSLRKTGLLRLVSAGSNSYWRLPNKTKPVKSTHKRAAYWRKHKSSLPILL